MQHRTFGNVPGEFDNGSAGLTSRIEAALKREGIPSRRMLANMETPEIEDLMLHICAGPGGGGSEGAEVLTKLWERSKEAPMVEPAAKAAEPPRRPQRRAPEPKPRPAPKPAPKAKVMSSLRRKAENHPVVKSIVRNAKKEPGNSSRARCQGHGTP